jgi:trimethylamine--corrinoid protein Co-methyltransferase
VANEEALDKLIFCARHGVPVIYTPIPLAGGTGPITAAGNIIQAAVDSWAGLVVAQQVRTGLPFFMGAVLSVMDMSAMILSYGAPELSLMMAGLTDLAHYVGIPLWQTGGCTDSKCLDEQAALEGSLSCFFSALSGGDLCHDVGYTESGMTGSILQAVMMDDAIGYSRRITRGIEVNEETLAADVIHAVGPDGHYLYEEHTMRHFKTEFWYPNLCDRHNFEEWEETGRKTMRQRVIERTREIIGFHKPSAVKPETARAITEIMNAAEERVKDKK